MTNCIKFSVDLKERYRNYSWEIRKHFDRIYRRVESILLECDLNEWNQDESTKDLLANKSFYIREGNEADDLADIVSTYPDELAAPTPAMPHAVLRDEIYNRFKTGMTCFVARDNVTDTLLGAIWLRDWYYPNALPLAKRTRKACAPGQLYTVPLARKKGVATTLMRYTLRVAKGKGYGYAYALVKPKRIYALRADLKAGFTMLGTCVHGCMLGKQFQKFLPGARLIPGSFPQVPVVIISTISHDGSTLLGMVRALGRHRIPVYLLVKGPLTYTNKSRYAYKIEQFTGEISDEELVQRLKAMLATVGSHKQRPVMMHSSENDIYRLQSIRPFLEEHFSVVPSDRVSNFLDKSNQLPLAIEAGFCVPQSMVLKSADELTVVCARLQFPIIVKPLARHTVGSFPEKVLVFNSQAIFVEQAKGFFVDEHTELIAQEYIPGDDSNVLVFMASCDSQGKVRSCVSGRKLRQNPPGFGFMASGLIDKNELMEEKSIKLCRLYRIRGFIGIEAKRREGSQDLYYIETSFRPEGFNALAEIAGTNLVLDTYMTAIGEPCFACPPSPTGSYMNLLYEIEATRTLVHAGKAQWTELLRPLPRPTAYSLFASDDPLPFFRWLSDAVRLKIKRLFDGFRIKTH